MCSEYTVKTAEKEIENALKVKLQAKTNETAWDTRVKFTRTAPVIGMKSDEFSLVDLIFPANPFPNSRLSQLKSNKTRDSADEEIVRIYDVPMWREGFSKYPCVIPMTSFYEPAYWGNHAGDVMEFSDPKNKILFIPGFLIKPRTPATGKLNGFTLLTHTASGQMLDYHHRLLMMLKPDAALEYLRMKTEEPMERFDFLVENRMVPEFKVMKDRTMAKGWEKRADHHLKSLSDETKYTNALKVEHVPA